MSQGHHSLSHWGIINSHVLLQLWNKFTLFWELLLQTFCFKGKYNFRSQLDHKAKKIMENRPGGLFVWTTFPFLIATGFFCLLLKMVGLQPLRKCFLGNEASQKVYHHSLAAIIIIILTMSFVYYELTDWLVCYSHPVWTKENYNHHDSLKTGILYINFLLCIVS